MVWCVENVIIDIVDIFERVNMSAKTYLIRKYSKILIRGTNFGKIRKNIDTIRRDTKRWNLPAFVLNGGIIY